MLVAVVPAIVNIAVVLDVRIVADLVVREAAKVDVHVRVREIADDKR